MQYTHIFPISCTQITFDPKKDDSFIYVLIVMYPWMVNCYIVLRLCHIINMHTLRVNIGHALNGQVVSHVHWTCIVFQT